MQRSLSFFERIEIQGEPLIYGSPNLEIIPWYGLSPGTKVTRIGEPAKSGKMTSSSRFDDFMPWVEYAGIIELSRELWMCFKLPPGGVITKKDKKPFEGEFYKLYMIFNDNDLLKPSHKRLNTYIYRGKFTKYQAEL